MPKQVVNVDRGGRKTYVLIPDDAPDSHSRMGILVGPPSLEGLGLPSRVELALHNELFNRGLITLKDVRRRPQEVFAAIQAAYRVDVTAVTNLYA